MWPGRISLKPDLQLWPAPEGGFLVRRAPLRVVQVNATAFALLRQIQAGYELPPRAQVPASLVRFLEALWRAKLVDWQPCGEHGMPLVSIIMPVFNQRQGIGAALEALLALDYPPDRREIIVVDDGSTDGTPAEIAKYPVKLLPLPKNRGQSAARNIGAAAARGDILAFIDSDCLAEPTWLRELVPYFQDDRVALVGGFVAGYYQTSWLDRYEEVQSPLNMGRETLLGEGPTSDFYVPTCNVLIRREAYFRVGGLNEDLRVGEDVDLCWRLKEQGQRLLYVPQGRVRHKHRHQCWPAFRRRFDYGTSEAFLFSRHPQVRKQFPWKPVTLGVLSCCLLFLLTLSPWLLAGVGIIGGGQVWWERHRVASHTGLRLPWHLVFTAVAKESLAWAFYFCYHLVRYYLMFLVGLGLLSWQALLAAVTIILLPLSVEYWRRQPRLPFLVYSVFFLLEQVFYQAGVLWGCCRAMSFAPYHLVFTKES